MIFSEDQILNEHYRKSVIASIKSEENSKRKTEAYKRYQVYKDKTIKSVIEKLASDGLHPKTIAIMQNRASNISICRKIINKLARAYNNGVIRATEQAEISERINELARQLNLDDTLRKSDRYRELYKNTMLWVKPERSYLTDDGPKYDLVSRTLSPWEYDVIESASNREKCKVVILSDFVQPAAVQYATEYDAGIHGASRGKSSDGIDAPIADNPADARSSDNEQYIWWSDNYHFTTDVNGRVIQEKSPEGLLNPIGMLPFVNNAEGQDGQFWAEGGDDLIDGSILINLLITDMFSIAYQQGWGQIVVTGKNLPEDFKVGPHNALLLEYNPQNEEPKPEVNVVNANPPLDLWMQAIEQYTALLLSTNNLSPSNIANRLDGSQFPSGIALLIEQSEAQNDVEDKQKEYQDIERQLWKISLAWLNVGIQAGGLTDRFAAIGEIPEDTVINIKFPSAVPVMTEQERLDAIQRRKDLGLNDMPELIMMDNPGMTRQEAEEKWESISESEAEKIESTIENSVINGDENDENSENENDEEMIDKTRKAPEISKEEALNGAQVASMVDVLKQVAMGVLPKQSAINIIQAAFNMAPDRANAIVNPIEINPALLAGNQEKLNG